VLTNLVANAAEAAGPGGRVRVVARRAGDWWELIVEDSGPGIPADVMPRLFEPFFTTRAPGKGTGLGLAVAHGIIEQHHGRIRAMNRPAAEGGGARFVVSLPLVAQAAAQLQPGARRTPPSWPSAVAAAVPSAVTMTESCTEPCAAASLSAADAPVPTPRLRVLVIDDEHTIRVALRRYFERRGWHVDEAEDGRAGYERLLDPTAQPYDVVISDLKMPGLSGIELHRRLSDERPAVLERLIFSTGDTASPEAASFLEHTRCPVLEKPFELLALAKAVDRMVAGPARAA
jgi:two-component system NtrC family sensor kinase